MFQAVSTMFNVFAKNLVAEINSEIHRKRKRQVDTKKAKKSKNARKLMKLTSL